MTLQQRERIGSIIRSVVVIAIALICAVPLYVIVINTFKSSAEMSMDPIGLPKTWNFENYTYAFGHLPIVNAFKNTIIVTVVGVGLQVLFGALAAYGMILKKSKFTAVIGVLLMLSFIIPGQTLLIPQYRMEAQVGLVDSLLLLLTAPPSVRQRRLRPRGGRPQSGAAALRPMRTCALRAAGAAAESAAAGRRARPRIRKGSSPDVAPCRRPRGCAPVM